MKLTLILTFIIFIAAAAAFILFHEGIYAISSDETSRTLIGYYWFTSGKLQSTSWLPLHFLTMKIGFYFLNDLIWLPRLISFLFGMMTIIIISLLSKELFNSARVMIYSAAIILLMPQRVILSIVPLPEIIFFFFISTASLFFVKWLKEQRILFLFITAAAITLASALRYEGWVFAAVFVIYILQLRKKPVISSALIFITLSFHLYWLTLNYIKYANVFYFLTEPENFYSLAQEVSLFNTIIFNPVTQFIEQGFITMNIIGIAGLLVYRKDAILRNWMYVFILPLLIFGIIALTGKGLPAHNFWRTSAVWMILLIPFTAVILEKLFSDMKYKGAAIILIIMFFVQLVNSNIYYIKNINYDITLTEEKMNTGSEIINYLKKVNVEEDDMVLIEYQDTFEHLEISLASSEPFRFVTTEKNSLTPQKLYDRSKLKLSYLLLKSDYMKKKALASKNYDKLLSSNGWILFGRKGQRIANIIYFISPVYGSMRP